LVQRQQRANYYQCFKDTDGKMEFANVGASIGGGV
jgi:hypothetical protein